MRRERERPDRNEKEMNTNWISGWKLKRASMGEWKSKRKRKRERCVLKLGNERYLQLA